MKSLFHETDVLDILKRIENLNPKAERQWGKMDIGQMLAHLNTSLETAIGLNSPKRLFIGRIIGPFVKPNYVSEKQLAKNSPTDKNYVFTDIREFEKEKEKSIALIKRFFEGGPSKCTTHPHSFFGKLTPVEWALTQWKHFDHHLRQFGA
jgi:Protein of unknown function (DUF1569)